MISIIGRYAIVTVPVIALSIDEELHAHSTLYALSHIPSRVADTK